MSAAAKLEVAAFSGLLLFMLQLRKLQQLVAATALCCGNP